MTEEPRILITGAGGQMGTALQRRLTSVGTVIAADRAMLDLAIRDQIRQAIRKLHPDVILNAGAYTAVDRAEAEPEAARLVNTEAPGILAEEALRCGALLIHYSTDYVFDGSKKGPWCETDIAHPLNVYGATKLAGEEAIRQVGGRYLVFRTSWIYSPHGRNFLLTMLRLGRERDEISVVDDQVGSPTSAAELAQGTCAIVEGLLEDRFAGFDGTGVWHMTCSGSTSWFGFAQAIFSRAAHLLNGRSPRVTPVSSADYPSAARRPLNSVLSSEKLWERFGVRLAPWDRALEAEIASALQGSR